MSLRFVGVCSICFSCMGVIMAPPGLAAEQPHVEDTLQEIVVTAPFVETEAQTALPIGILSGEALREKIANSLGGTLKNEIGVNNASFGTGVGQPIIRGQSGNRVSILQNGISLADASNVSPDHANGVEAVLAERLEVLRGPSALLYGSGAIGGVVNVIDGRIPEQLAGRTRFFIEQSHNTVSDENKTVFKLDTSSGAVGFHVDAFRRENDDVEINGFAIDEAAVEALEELGEAHEDEHEEEEELPNSRGFIANSDGKAEGATVGFSHVGDYGFVGFSFSGLENEYGLPPGTHGHHGEEEHEDEHEEEEHEEEEEGLELVRLELDQTRYDFKGQYRFTDSWFDHIRANVSYTDYEHQEIEIEPDGTRLVGTVYDNEGFEGRVTLNRAGEGGRQGVWGVQFSRTEFGAFGEEAFIPESDVDSIGIFGVERYQLDNITGEFGVRYERNSVDPGGACSYSESSVSLSASMLYDFNEESNLLAAVTRSQRGATVEELYSNVSLNTCSRFADDEDLVSHAATALLEIGNPSLDVETSGNFELGLRKHSGRVTGEISAYYNEIEDYIFLDITGEEVDEQAIAGYFARDATFSGLEAEVSVNLLDSAAGDVVLSVFGDLVDAEFDSGGDVPRIPAAKLGAELRWFGSNWSMHFHATRVMRQNDTAALELPTGAYTLASIYADYHWNLRNDSDIKLFVKADNLLDEEIRNHASFLKNFAPEPGRGFRLGLRWEY